MGLKSMVLTPKFTPTKIKPCKLITYRVKSGDAENRTRVQTSSQKAFYILSSFLIFVQKLIKNNPLLTYLL